MFGTESSSLADLGSGAIRIDSRIAPAFWTVGRLAESDTAKPLVFGDDKPLRRNSPSSPELFSADPTQCDLERERAQLIAAIDSFATRGAACCSRHPHPFFGPLKPQQWAIIMYKHLDHHLRQFGG